MSRSATYWNDLTRRKVMAVALASIMGFTWFLISLIPGGQASTPQPENPSSDTQSERTPRPRNVNEEPQTPVDLSRPEIITVSLLSEWDGGDRMDENRSNSLPQGEEAIIGYRYRTQATGGEIQLSVSINVAGETRNRTVRRTVQQSEPVVDEAASRFRTSDWSVGTKQVEVVLRNADTGYVSDPFVAEFEITQS